MIEGSTNIKKEYLPKVEYGDTLLLSLLLKLQTLRFIRLFVRSLSLNDCALKFADSIVKGSLACMVAVQYVLSICHPLQMPDYSAQFPASCHGV